MNDVLIVLNPRRIVECVDAIEDLEIDKVWLRNMAEDTIVTSWDLVLEAIAPYDWAWVLSDDCAPTQRALDAVRRLAFDMGHPVVTGYCNLDASDQRVNITRSPFASDVSTADAYDFYSRDELDAWPRKMVPTGFAGFCLTGMATAWWKRYPFQRPGRPSDFDLCRRLQADGVKIVAARDGFVFHVKERWNYPDQEDRKRLLVGVEPPSIDLEVRAFA